MKVIIAGGRDFNNYELLKEKCDYYLKNINDIEIVSGVACGADKLGEKYASDKNYSIKRFPADWDTLGRGAGHIRNAQIHTITAVDHNACVSAFISKYYGGDGVNGSDVSEPLHTVTAKDRCGLVTASFISRQFGTSTGHKTDEPLGTTTGANKSSLVQVYLEKYGIDNNIEINGEKYTIVDICMRMLKPRELYDAQGFPHDYEIETDCYGNRYPISKQVARCGNSVPPQFATAIVRANWAEKCVDYDINTMAAFNEEIA